MVIVISPKDGNVGSTPTRPAIKLECNSIGRVVASEAICYRFESYYSSHHDDGV